MFDHRNDVTCCILHQTLCFSFKPNVSNLLSSDHKIFFPKPPRPLSHKGRICEEQMLFVEVCSGSPVSASDCNPFSIVFCLLNTSLTIALLTWALSLSIVLVVWYFFLFCHNVFHSAPRNAQNIADVLIIFSVYVPPKNFISKLHRHFPGIHNSKTDLICHVGCETSP